MFQTASRTHKISHQIIEQIRNAILSGRFKPGDKVASEKELMSEFAVSKATLREALRVLEGMGLVEIKKGIAGGVFIAEVDMKTTIHGIINFLHFKAVSVRDITMIRYLLEPPVAQIAASRIQPEDIVKLESMIVGQSAVPQTIVSREIGFHRYLARMTENPILILVMDFIDNILNDVKFQLDPGVAFYHDVARAHQAILECLKRRDGIGARKEIVRDLLEVGNHLATISGTQPFDPTMLLDETLPVPFHRASLSVDQSLNEVLVSKDLKQLFGEETADRLHKQGVVFRRIGTGELYFIALGRQGGLGNGDGYPR
ncbi:MAG TPA: GntR family transcriptional regulator [Thermodesulfobacteriota bacterium]|nr:GntR family transcriptional regulator [Thermodesulfobacteriota bacterium]